MHIYMHTLYRRSILLYLHDVHIPLSSFFFDCKPPGEKGYSDCHEIDQICAKKKKSINVHSVYFRNILFVYISDNF